MLKTNKKSSCRSYRKSLKAALCLTTLALFISYGFTRADQTADTLRDIGIIRQRILEPFMTAPDKAEVLRITTAIQDDGSWSDIDYADRQRSGWKTPEHISRLLLLARAVKVSGSPLSEDSNVRRALFDGLDYWLDNDFRNPNWWWNVIGVPRSLSPVLMMIEDDIDNDRLDNGISILERGKIGMTGQNLVWVALITVNRGILLKDAGLIHTAIQSITDEIRISDGEGIKADFSFWQHGNLLYSHGYGSGFASDCSRIASIVAGTQFAFPREKIDLLTSLVLDGHQWMMRCHMSDYSARGREISRWHINGRYMKSVAENMLSLPTGRDAEFEALAKRVDGILDPPFEGNRHFHKSDFMTHHRRGYYSSVRMYSDRVLNTDGLINEEGLKDHHIGDGCNFLFRDGDEYYDIFPVWDWQKVPGTTVVRTPELSGDYQRKGETSFVGGVSDGTYGFAAFDFRRYDLTARKTWFFFDREYVCLGSGISCASGYPVVTTVNQCLLRGKVTLPETGDTVTGGVHEFTEPFSIHHDGVLYCFPGRQAVRLENDTRTGSWYDINHMYPESDVSLDVFTLWIDHGESPENAGYEYIVVPDIDTGDIGRYRQKDMRIRMLRNDPAMQAVSHDGLGVTGIAFYEPGSLADPEGFSVGADIPCLVLLRDRHSELHVTVANPVNEPASVTISVSAPLRGPDSIVDKNTGSTRITFDLPGGDAAGSSVTKTFRRVQVR